MKNKKRSGGASKHWRKLLIVIMIAALSFSTFPGTLLAFAAGNEILVDISGATTDLQRGTALRAAINGASDGDTIVIPAGTYDVASGGGGINVGNKAINLKGAGSGQTILDGSKITSTTTAAAAIFKQRIDDVTKTITYSGITFQKGGTSKSSGIDFICYHDTTPDVSSTLILNDIAVIGNGNAGVNINSANVVANGLQSSGNALAGVSIGDPHGSATFIGNDYKFAETYSGASTINKKVGVYVDKANNKFTIKASYKDAIKVAQALFGSSATATETPVDNFVIAGGGFRSLFYLGLPDPASITLPTGSKTLTKNGQAVAMTENQFSFSVIESASNGGTATNTEFVPSMAADGNIVLHTNGIPINSAGTYTYTVRETGTAPGGYTYDTNYYEISYAVSKGSTALKVENPIIKEYDSSGNLLSGTTVKFDNEYSASGSGDVAVTKELTGGKALTAGMFDFTITQTNSDWEAMTDGYTQTVGNDTDGTIPFSAIDYTQEGTYNYTITENGGSLGGITYDDSVIKVTMTVTDDGAGNLTATPSYEGGQKFTNGYEGPGSITVTKKVIVLTNDDSIKANYSFYAALFENRDGQLVRVSDVKRLDVVDSADATAIFDKLDLDKTYYAYETDEEGNIIETQTDGTITAPIIPDWTHILYENNAISLNSDGMTGSAIITNVFDPEDLYQNGAIVVKKTVTVDGQKGLSNKTFYVGLFSDKEKTKPVSEVKALKMNGNSSTTVEFITDKDGNPLVAGEKYYIAETDKNGAAITDSLEQLGCEITIDHPFVVVTEKDVKVNLVNNFAKEESPLTGDDTNRSLWLLLMAMSGIAIAGSMVYASKRHADSKGK